MEYNFENKIYQIEIRQTINLDCERHLHSHIELGYVTKGSSKVFIDGVEYPLQYGDFFIAFPNQIHAFANSENLKCILTIVSIDMFPELREIFTEYLPEMPVIRAGGTDIETLMFMLSHNGSFAPAEFLHGIMLAVCSKALDMMKLNKLDKYDADILKNVLIYIEQNFTEQITIDSAAEHLHISSSRLSHIFRGKLDTTFTKYVTSKRIGYARSLLKNTTLSVTDIAFRTGFNSVRTFNRAFVRSAGVAPREYRK